MNAHAEILRPLAVCDAGQWLRRMRLTGTVLTRLLEMAVGDELVLFEFSGPPLAASGPVGIGRARIERRQAGQWRFDALWTLSIGHACPRGSIYAVGEFAIHGPCMLSWDAQTGEAMRRFQRIVRLGTRLI